MLRIKGTYQNGRVRLDSNPVVKIPVKVIVTFPEMDAPEETGSRILKWNDFSFEKKADDFSKTSKAHCPKK